MQEDERKRERREKLELKEIREARRKRLEKREGVEEKTRDTNETRDEGVNFLAQDGGDADRGANDIIHVPRYHCISQYWDIRMISLYIPILGYTYDIIITIG